MRIITSRINSICRHDDAKGRSQSRKNDVAIPVVDNDVAVPAVDNTLHDIITGNDQVFVLRDNVVFKYDNASAKLIETDFSLVAPDYVAIARQKINEICLNVKYESCMAHPNKTESFVFDTVLKANIIDVLKCDVDISLLSIKPVVEFLISVNADVVEILKKLLGFEGAHPDLDIPTVCIIGIKSILDVGSEEEIAKLKKILLLTSMVMEQIDRMKAAVKPTADNKDSTKPKPDTDTKVDEKKEPAKKEDNKKGSSK